MKIIAIAAIALLATGCVETKTNEQMFAESQNVCQRVGFEPGSDRYKMCVLGGYQQAQENKRRDREQELRDFDSAMAGMRSGWEVYSPQNTLNVRYW